MGQFEFDAVLVGGCGHVGLPLGIAFAISGLNVVLQDISASAVETVNSGRVPFVEPGAEEALTRCLGNSIRATTDPSVVSKAEMVIVIIGTPVDEHQNPEPHKVVEAIRDLAKYMVPGQLLVLRSTVYPGTTALIEGLLKGYGLDLPVAFCPERIAEGKAMDELFSLPQIVSARTPEDVHRASVLFQHLTPKIVEMTPEEAELAKLFTNTWRYIKFAAANQLFMMAQNFGLSYEKIRQGLREDYPRASDLPSSGFAAGPCLLKDTLQLAAFNNNDFVLGHAAINVNEGLPLYLVSRLSQHYNLCQSTVGILGMAFKAESDDIRSSLAYKLKRILRYRAKSVLTTDPFITQDHALVPIDEVLTRADILIIGAPHAIYKDLQYTQPVIDIWGLLGMETGL